MRSQSRCQIASKNDEIGLKRSKIGRTYFGDQIDTMSLRWQIGLIITTRFQRWMTLDLFDFYRSMLCIAPTVLSLGVCPSILPSVRLSVRCVPIFYGNGLRYCYIFLIVRYPNYSSFMSIKHLLEMPTKSPLRGR